MDREQLRKAAEGRRNQADTEATKATVWRCEFCTRDFMTELGFMKHHCRERDRIEQLKSPLGQAAYAAYGEWMRQQRRSVPPAETFMSSKQYNNFIKFAEWAEKTAIPNTSSFIKLMVDSGTQPVLWCRSSTYELYIQHFDTVFPPEQQFVESLEQLKLMAIDHGCELSELFQVLGAFELAKLVRRRKISPWILVVSQKFLRWAQSLPQLERDVLNEAVNFMTYAGRLNTNRELARLFREACEQEGL